MKTKLQKTEDLKRGKELLDKSQTLIFVDFTAVPTSALRNLRKDLKSVGAKLFVLKKRLLNLLLKEKGVAFDTAAQKLSLGTIFSSGDVERTSSIVFKFFAGLEIPEGGAKDVWVKHIIGGHDLKVNSSVSAEQIIFIGKLPPREVLLAQFLGMLVAPLRSFMYLLDQKSKKVAE